MPTPAVHGTTTHKTTTSKAPSVMLRLGARGANVQKVQRRLAQLGFKVGPADGLFGPNTRAAVIAYQKRQHLTADGVVGPQTWGSLFATAPAAPKTAPKSKPKTQPKPASGPSKTAKSSTGSGPALRLGSRGSAVTALQKQLSKLGFKPGAADGVFGKGTLAAVRSFQKAKGLVADGVVGPRTWAKLGITVKGSSGTSGSSGVGGVKTPSGSFAQKVLDLARSQLGTRETPMGSNHQKYSKYFGRGNEPWCADFVSWVYTHAGKKLNIPYTPTLLAHIKANGTYHRYNPKPGEIVLYDWAPGSGVPAEHTGLVEKVWTKNGVQYMQTIEGNYGNMVKRRVIAVSNPTIRGFGS